MYRLLNRNTELWYARSAAAICRAAGGAVHNASAPPFDDLGHGNPQARRQLPGGLGFTGPAPDDGADVLPGNAAFLCIGRFGQSLFCKFGLDFHAADGHCLTSYRAL